MIERPLYLEKLISKKENGLIKIITGNRTGVAESRTFCLQYIISI